MISFLSFSFLSISKQPNGIKKSIIPFLLLFRDTKKMKIATQLSRIKAQNTIELSFSAPWEPKQKPNIRVQLFFSFPLSLHVSRHPNGKVGFQLSYASPPVKEPNKLKPETKTRERERERIIFCFPFPDFQDRNKNPNLQSIDLEVSGVSMLSVCDESLGEMRRRGVGDSIGILITGVRKFQMWGRMSVRVLRGRSVTGCSRGRQGQFLHLDQLVQEVRVPFFKPLFSAHPFLLWAKPRLRFRRIQILREKHLYLKGIFERWSEKYLPKPNSLVSSSFNKGLFD